MACAVLVAVVAPLATMTAPAQATQLTPTADEAPAAARADIDGDGRGDRITVRKVSNRRCAVRVVTARGKADRIVLRSSYASGQCGLHGTANIDPRRGKEIVAITDLGAHTAYQKVVTWRRGVLRTERLGRSRDWVTDGSVWSAVGVHRKKVDGKPRIITWGLVQKGNTRFFTGARRAFAFRDGNWVKVGQRHVKVTAHRAGRLSGWHIVGLRNF